MSMTREEAIVYFESLQKRFEEMRETETSYWGKVHAETTIEATRVALSALRPVSREMVERMFPGCEKCKSVCHRCLNYPVALYPKACRTCVEHSNYESASNFCEDCGKPLTDEAVEMVMERLEALYEV